ncbi:hypothetical protein [Novosphingobium capsulatum]|uniref:hypothetical protein n=1 Tax=Novosphingobium capsulatum TaxID=13688 RepID=UPI0007889289|nr:hypothetical protein [Novosphingobium capsulatum]WQD92405.1 hypothetical protein U0041_15635 [Novosphingobium capsulatum]
MNVNTSVNLTPAEEAELQEVLRCTQAELNARMAEFGRAALREYVDMLLGQAVLRSPDNREHRLLLIITEAFNGRIPKAADIGRWFNLTSTGASSLIRKLLSRYRLRLDQPIRDAVIALLQDCEAEADGFRHVTVTNPIVIEYLNDILAERNGDLKRILREAGTGMSYLVPEDSYLELAGVYHP